MEMGEDVKGEGGNLVPKTTGKNEWESTP